MLTSLNHVNPCGEAIDIGNMILIIAFFTKKIYPQQSLRIQLLLQRQPPMLKHSIDCILLGKTEDDVDDDNGVNGTSFYFIK